MGQGLKDNEKTRNRIGHEKRDKGRVGLRTWNTKHGTGAGTLDHQRSINKLMEPIAHAKARFQAAG